MVCSKCKLPSQISQVPNTQKYNGSQNSLNYINYNKLWNMAVIGSFNLITFMDRCLLLREIFLYMGNAKVLFTLGNSTI